MLNKRWIINKIKKNVYPQTTEINNLNNKIFKCLYEKINILHDTNIFYLILLDYKDIVLVEPFMTSYLE